LVHFFVKVGGGQEDPDLQQKLVDVRIESTIHLPDMAVLTFRDKGKTMDLVDGGKFEVGKSLKILARTGNNDIRIFDGEIIQVEPQFTYPNVLMVVRAFDRLHKLNRGKFTRDFQNMSDADVAKKIGSELGLNVSKIENTSPIHKYVFQENETNLQFLQKRASKIGYTVFVRDQELHFELPKESDIDKKIELNWGQDGLMEFQPVMTSLAQYTEIEVRGWDPDTKKALVARAKKGDSHPEIKPTDHPGQAQKASGDQKQILTTTLRSQKEVDLLAKAEADRRSGAFVQAEGICGGNPNIVAGVKITIPNIGDTFKGTYTVTHVAHVYRSNQSYTTEFSISAQHTNTLMAMLKGESDG
jgi:phage protein D